MNTPNGVAVDTDRARAGAVHVFVVWMYTDFFAGVFSTPDALDVFAAGLKDTDRPHLYVEMVPLDTSFLDAKDAGPEGK